MKNKQKRLLAQDVSPELPAISSLCSNFRIDALRAIATANVTVAALSEMVPFLTKFTKPGCILGHVGELPRSYTKKLHKKLQ